MTTIKYDRLKHKDYLQGQQLLKMGFKCWFLYFFKKIENKKFILDEPYEEIFRAFQEIFDGKITRLQLWVCPRIGKTTISAYFIAFCYAVNRKCNFIYTSFNASLTIKTRGLVYNIMSHPLYKQLYLLPSPKQEYTKNKAVDEFWEKYDGFEEEADGIKVKNGLLRTTANGSDGVGLFTSLGSMITGFGCGEVLSVEELEEQLKNNTFKFSGCLLIDDANKPSDVKSEHMRKKTIQYYTETLLTRLNNEHVAIINFQQRLHQDDLSGQINKKYPGDFKIVKIPVLDENGNITLPSRFTRKKIEELQKDPYTFQAQYMQAPMSEAGQIFGENSLQRYFCQKEQIPHIFATFFTCDMSYTNKATSNYLCLCYWGVSFTYNQYGLPDKKLYLLDFVYDKFPREFDRFTLLAQFINNNFNFINHEGGLVTPQGIYLENNNNGDLIPRLEQLNIINVNPKININGKWCEPIFRGKSKEERARDIIGSVSSKKVFIPSDDLAQYYSSSKLIMLQKMVKEFEIFPDAVGDGSHGDFVDNVIDGVIVGLNREIW